MRKLMILMIALSFMMSGCAKNIYHIYLFTLDTCGSCQSLKSAIGDIEKEHQEIYVTIYDLDTPKNMKIYKKALSLLKGYKGNKQVVPLMLMDGYFGKVGYKANEKNSLPMILRRLSRVM